MLSITFFLRPDEAMLVLAWQKPVYANKIISVIAIQGVYAIILDIKQNEKLISLGDSWSDVSPVCEYSLSSVVLFCLG